MITRSEIQNLIENEYKKFIKEHNTSVFTSKLQDELGKIILNKFKEMYPLEYIEFTPVIQMKLNYENHVHDGSIKVDINLPFVAYAKGNNNVDS